MTFPNECCNTPYSCCCGQPEAEHFRDWIRQLDEDVIQGEYGYEPGEFTIYKSHWVELYEDGLSPRQAWQRALDGYANKRREEEAERDAHFARIVEADRAAIARERAKLAKEQQVLDHQLQHEIGARAMAPEGSRRKLPGQADQS